jgi:hypothetical protein
MLTTIVLARLFMTGDAYAHHFEGEMGFIEDAIVAVLACAVVWGTLAYLRRRSLPSPWLGVWVLFSTASCFLIAGEEASWGQHWFGWAVPAPLEWISWSREINLHIFLDLRIGIAPKTLILIWVFVSGIVIPVLRWRAGRAVHSAPTDPWYWFLPTNVCFPVAVLCGVFRTTALASSLWNEFNKAGGLDMELTEIIEFYIAYFLLLYLASFYYRLRQVQR